MKRTIAMLLVLSTLLCLFVACKEEPVITNTGDTETIAPRDEEELSDNLPDKNMELFEFRILTNHPERLTWAETILVPDDYTGEDIYDAMFERNEYLAERFNCEFTVTQGSPTALNSDAQIQNLAMSGDSATAPHLIMHYDKWVLNSAQVFLDWNTVPYISIGEDYWNPGISNLYNIKGKQIALSGSFSLGMLSNTTIYLFNKEMYEQYYGDLSSIYNCVTDGEWTIEKFYETALGVVENPDAIWDKTDQFGVDATCKALYSSLIVGSDIHFVEMIDDNIPFFSLPSDSYAIEKLQKILQLCQDNDVHYNTSTNVHNSDGNMAFTNGLALFHVKSFYHIPSIRASMEKEFGILPTPKYNVEQENYRNISNGGEMACLMITVRDDEMENIGILMEALSFDSHQNLMPVYKEKMLKTRFASDEDSRAMVQLIFDTTVGELGINVFEDVISVPFIEKVYMPKKDVISSTLSGMSSVHTKVTDLVKNIK